MSKWDSNAVNDRLKSGARWAENYLNEVREKVKHNNSYEILFDEYLAKFQVYGYLYDRTFLETREGFLAELRQLHEYPHNPIDNVYDRERFTKFYKMYVNELLTAYEKSSDADGI